MKSQKLGIRKIYRHLDKILSLFFVLFVFMELFWIPTNSFFAELLLAQTGEGYLSYNNITRILFGHPFVSLGFLILLLVNLLIAYLQMGMIFLGINNLLEDKESSLRAYMKRTFQDVYRLVKDFHLSKVVYVLVYASVIFPFLKRVLKIYYLNKILIPEFILTYLEQNLFIAILLGVFGLVTFWIGFRWIFSLPKIIFEGYQVKPALAYSWEKTKKRTWYYMRSLTWLVMKSLFLFFGLSLFSVFIQVFADALENVWSFVFAVLNYTMIHLSYYIAISYFLIKLVSFLTEKDLPAHSHKKREPIFRMIIVFATAGIFLGEGSVYLDLPENERPLLISHRGVSEANGVQNTIESLEKTAQLKPDYVEMDVQETKDHQFVMMHDANLKALTGLDKAPQDLTLEELTQLDVKENGYETKIPSFEAYLNKANELGQKLLIEIKVSSKDSPDMMKRFLQQYGAIMKRHGHQLHSLDYQVVQSVKNYDRQIPVFFILPYNTIFPQTRATGYTMEYSTLDESFMFKLFLNNKEVYDWTVNDEGSIQKSLYLGVNGIITDNLQLVREEISESEEDQDYTNVLLGELWALTNPT